MTATEKQEATQRLIAGFTPGQQVWVLHRGQAANGHKVDIYTFMQGEDGRLVKQWLTYLFAVSTGRRFNQSSETVTINAGYPAHVAIAEELTALCGFTVEAERL